MTKKIKSPKKKAAVKPSPTVAVNCRIGAKLVKRARRQVAQSAGLHNLTHLVEVALTSYLDNLDALEPLL